ncbi:hypothetical protein [Pseudodesulfovibrio tunisiensis]|uniref:hypothetical protein n=1 Tax=Pseudodesulfovibrio tunisiensis TaxID=463192 RepID=UPI001FB495CC|nr:hypothetical protein [Pseudodesulfovibrio tunisiensis]
MWEKVRFAGWRGGENAIGCTIGMLICKKMMEDQECRLFGNGEMQGARNVQGRRAWGNTRGIVRFEATPQIAVSGQSAALKKKGAEALLRPPASLGI